MKLKIHFLESHLDSSQKISAKSVTNTVKDFTKTFWLRKSRTKASGPDVCWQTIAGHWRGMYLKPITGENHMPLHFRGKFLPVSLVHKVLFCTNRVLCIFETLPDKKNYVYISEFSMKSSAKFKYWSSWAKKKKELNFVVQCNLPLKCGEVQTLGNNANKSKLHAYRNWYQIKILELGPEFFVFQSENQKCRD